MVIQYGELKLQWLGHDGFLLTGNGKHLYIDPYQIDPRNKPSADILCITHSHYDHLSVPDIEQLVTPKTIVLCPPDCASKLGKFRMGKLVTLEPGQRHVEDDVTIEAVPAYNDGKPFHPKDNGWLGFVITIEKVRVYHTGDTDLIPEMKKIRCDIALLPVSGTYVMTAEEAAKAANLIEPELAIPMHWGALVGAHGDAETFKKQAKCKVLILEKEA